MDDDMDDSDTRQRNLDALDLATHKNVSTFTLPIIVTRHARPPAFDPDLNRLRNCVRIEAALTHSLTRLPRAGRNILRTIPRLVATYVAEDAFREIFYDAINDCESFLLPVCDTR